MKNKLLTCLGLLSLILSNLSYAETATGNAETTASIGGNCLLEVDDLAFGDVTFQTMNGSGDVTATTDLRLLCTKNATVTLSSNNGANGTGNIATVNESFIIRLFDAQGVTRYVTEGVYLERAITYLLGGDPNVDISAVYNPNSSAGRPGTHNIYGEPIERETPFRQSFFCDCPNHNWSWSIVAVDGSTFNETNQLQASVFDTAAMSNGSSKITYQLSTTSSFNQEIGSTESNEVTYDQNDGQYQTFTLYGKANVLHAEPGVYVDTNTMTVHF